MSVPTEWYGFLLLRPWTASQVVAWKGRDADIPGGELKPDSIYASDPLDYDARPGHTAVKPARKPRRDLGPTQHGGKSVKILKPGPYFGQCGTVVGGTHGFLVVDMGGGETANFRAHLHLEFPGDSNFEEEWLTTGSEWIGQRVTRSFPEGPPVGGHVEKWLPKGSGDDEPALYKVVHDDGDMEDLEEHEVREAREEYLRATSKPRPASRAVAKSQVVPGTSNSDRMQQIAAPLDSEDGLKMDGNPHRRKRMVPTRFVAGPASSKRAATGDTMKREPLDPQPIPSDEAVGLSSGQISGSGKALMARAEVAVLKDRYRALKGETPRGRFANDVPWLRRKVAELEAAAVGFKRIGGGGDVNGSSDTTATMSSEPAGAIVAMEDGGASGNEQHTDESATNSKDDEGNIQTAEPDNTKIVADVLDDILTVVSADERELPAPTQPAPAQLLPLQPTQTQAPARLPRTTTTDPPKIDPGDKILYKFLLDACDEQSDEREQWFIGTVSKIGKEKVRLSTGSCCCA